MAEQELKLKVLGDSKSGVTALEDVDKAVEKTGDGVKKTASGSDELRGAFVGLAVAGAGVSMAIGNATQVASDYGKQVILLQRMTGATAEESSKWAAILGRYGVEGSKAALVIKSITTAIVTHSKALSDLGVETQNADGSNRTALEVMADLAEVYSTSKDKTAVLAAGTKALGRGFADLLPLLAGGKQAIADLAEEAEKNGLIFSDSDVAQVKEYNKAVADNEQAVKGMTVQWGLAAMPAETFKAKTLGGLLRAMRETTPEVAEFGGGVASIGGPVLAAAGAVGGLITVIKDGPGALKNLGKAGAVLGPLASGASGFGQAARVGFQLAAEGAGIAEVSTLGVGASIGGLVRLLGIPGLIASGMIALADASYKTSEAAKAQDVAQGYVVGSGQRWYQTTYQNAQALGRQTGAIVNLHQATAGLPQTFMSAHTGAATLTKTLATHAQTAAEAASAERDLEAALIGAGQALDARDSAELTSLQAKQNVKQAEKDLAQAIKDHGRKSDEARIATLMLKDAREAASDAANKHRDATKAEADAQRLATDRQHAANRAYVESAAGTKNLSAGQETLASKLNKATDRVQKLKDKLNTVPKEKRSEVKAEIAKAEKNVAKIKKEIGSVHDRTVELHVDVTVSQRQRFLSNVPILAHPIKKNAYGSIMKATPGGVLNVAAEDGRDEAAIPLYPSERNRELAAIAARATGLFDGAAASLGSAPSMRRGTEGFVFAPVLNINADSLSDRRAIREVTNAELSAMAFEARALIAGGSNV